MQYDAARMRLHGMFYLSRHPAALIIVVIIVVAVVLYQKQRQD